MYFFLVLHLTYSIQLNTVEQSFDKILTLTKLNFHIMNIQPIGNRVLVELAKQAKTTASGFIISAEDKTEQQKGIIISVGEGFGEEKDLMKEFHVGQTILFGRYGGEEIKDDSGEISHKIVNAKDIYGIIK